MEEGAWPSKEERERRELVREKRRREIREEEFWARASLALVGPPEAGAAPEVALHGWIQGERQRE